MHDAPNDVKPRTCDALDVPKGPEEAPQGPVPAPGGPALGPAEGDEAERRERALTGLLELAVSRGDLALAAQVMDEVRAARLAASPNVVDLAATKRGAR